MFNCKVHITFFSLIFVFQFYQFLLKFIYFLITLIRSFKEDGGSLWRLPLGWHLMTYIPLERSRRVKQLSPLCQSDPWTTRGARGRQSRNFFRGFFHFEGVLIVNWPSEIDLSRSRIDRINSFWDITNWNLIFIKTILKCFLSLKKILKCMKRIFQWLFGMKVEWKVY